MSSPRTNINRLLRLAALLRDLPRKNFDMEQWYGPDIDKGSKAKCGMVCCIGGWATAIHPSLTFSYNGPHFGRLDGAAAFAAAFDISNEVAHDLTNGEAPHRTPKAAARAVEAVAADLAAEHDYEIVEVPS